METKIKNPAKYTDKFKKAIISLCSFDKTYSQILKEYSVSLSTLSIWLQKYSQVRVDDDSILLAQQVKAL